MKPEELVKWLAEQCPDECVKAVQEYIEQQAEQLRIAREFLQKVCGNRIPWGETEANEALAAISDPGKLLAERDARVLEKYAEKIFEDDWGCEVEGRGYYDQGGDAKQTIRNIRDELLKEASRIRAEGGK